MHSRWPVHAGLRHLARRHVPIRHSHTTLSQPPQTHLITTPTGQTYEPIIGLEVHAQLLTSTKLFSPAPSLPSSSSPNIAVDPTDAAFPGTLPVLNAQAVTLAVKTALALESDIQLVSSFDRKHYFYPDLPPGYQITQFWNPIARGGSLAVGMADGLPYTRRVRFMQIQLEQDSGKSVLGVKDGQTLVDLNRAGVGVLELITEPDLRSSLETVTFLKKLQRLLWYTSISSPDMDEGAWRCDINVSVRPLGAPYGTRTEIKHLVKFTSIKAAIEYEIDRQVQLLELGQPVQQETRSFDPRLAQTVRLRGKEGVQDYRYMPEPDLPSIHLTPAFISNISQTLPEPLDTRRTRLAKQYKLSPYQIEILMSEPGAVEYFEKVAVGRRGGKVANWIIGDLFGSLRSRHLNLLSCTVQPTRLGALIDLVETGRVSGLRAKDILHTMMDGNTQSPLEIAQEQGWILASDVQALEKLCEELLEEFPEMAVKVRNGKTRVIKFFVGEVMKRTKGKSDPVLVAEVFAKLFKM